MGKAESGYEKPKYKKGDYVLLTWNDDSKEIYKINGVRKSRNSGHKHYLSEHIGLLSGKYRTYFEKPYDYVFDWMDSRIATEEEIKRCKRIMKGKVNHGKSK
jgi:hypothetical protein